MKVQLVIFALAITIIALVVAGCDYIGRAIMAQKPWPHYVKLADFTNDTATARLVWPDANCWSFNLILAIPLKTPADWPLSRDCPKYEGTVSVQDMAGVQVGSFNVNPSTSQHCNWLTQYSLDAFIIGWQQTNCLKTVMVAGKQYEIIVRIPSRPKEFTSLWLGYVQ